MSSCSKDQIDETDALVEILFDFEGERDSGHRR